MKKSEDFRLFVSSSSYIGFEGSKLEYPRRSHLELEAFFYAEPDSSRQLLLVCVRIIKRTNTESHP